MEALLALIAIAIPIIWIVTMIAALNTQSKVDTLKTQNEDIKKSLTTGLATLQNQSDLMAKRLEDLERRQSGHQVEAFLTQYTPDQNHSQPTSDISPDASTTPDSPKLTTEAQFLKTWQPPEHQPPADNGGQAYLQAPPVESLPSHTLPLLNDPTLNDLTIEEKILKTWQTPEYQAVLSSSPQNYAQPLDKWAANQAAANEQSEGKPGQMSNAPSEAAAVLNAAPQNKIPAGQTLTQTIDGFIANVMRVAGVFGIQNIWVLMGILCLFAGLIFFIRYAVEHGLLPPGLRVTLSASIGLAIFTLGWLHRNRRQDLALILQGGGIGITYLSIVAAVRMYFVLPPSLAFGILFVVVLGSAAAAISQNSRVMINIANFGGYSAPLFIGVDYFDYSIIFAFYALLTGGLVVISHYRTWRELNSTAFAFTVMVGLILGPPHLTPDTRWTMEFFLVLFFVLFTILAISGSNPKAFMLKDGAWFDVPLTFMVPTVFFLFQSHLIKNVPYGLALSCAVQALSYAGVAMFLKHENLGGSKIRLKQDIAEISETLINGATAQRHIYMLLSIIFANLALALTLEEFSPAVVRYQLLAMSCGLQAAFLYGRFARQQAPILTNLSYGILMAGIICHLFYIQACVPAHGGFEISLGRLISLGLSSILPLSIMAMGLIMETLGRDAKNQSRQQAGLALHMAGAVFLYQCLFFELRHLTYGHTFILILAAAYSHLLLYAGRRFKLPLITGHHLALWLISFMATIPLAATYLENMFLKSLTSPSAPFTAELIALLTISLAETYLWYHHKNLRPEIGKAKAHNCFAWWAGTALICTVFLSMAALGRLDSLSIFWVQLVNPAWAAIFLAARKKYHNSLTGDAPIRLKRQAAAPLFVLTLWLTLNMFAAGNPAPFSYVPFLNPIDLGLALAAGAFYYGLKGEHGLWPQLNQQFNYKMLFIFILLLALTISLARTCAFWADMDFSMAGALRTPIYQSLLAILWAAAGLICMGKGHRQALRWLWITGVIIISAVIIKLVLVDLTSLGTIWRILSFMAVGGLLIIIGYLFPLPPASLENAEQEAPAQ